MKKLFENLARTRTMLQGERGMGGYSAPYEPPAARRTLSYGLLPLSYGLLP